MKMTFCIPTMNRAEFIGETLESIISQAGNDVEIVIVDGGSRDNTEAVVESFARTFPALRYVRSPVRESSRASLRTPVSTWTATTRWRLRAANTAG